MLCREERSLLSWGNRQKAWKLAAIGFTRREVWADFRDFWSNLIYFCKNHSEFGKYSVLSMCRVNDMANKIKLDPKSVVRKSRHCLLRRASALSQSNKWRVLSEAAQSFQHLYFWQLSIINALGTLCLCQLYENSHYVTDIIWFKELIFENINPTCTALKLYRTKNEHG